MTTDNTIIHAVIINIFLSFFIREHVYRPVTTNLFVYTIEK